MTGPTLPLRRPSWLCSLQSTLGFDPPPDLSLGAFANFVPMFLYFGTRPILGTQAAIAIALVALLVLFVSDRRVGVLRFFATTTAIVATVAGAIGLALNSDSAFLMREPIGDLLAGAVLIASLVMRRPLVGLIAHEVSPRAMGGQNLRLGIFYWLTMAWLAYVLLAGSLRIFLLTEELSPETYFLLTRGVSWPIIVLLLAASAVLTARRVRMHPIPAPMPA